jgi:hypothetical protein
MSIIINEYNVDNISNLLILCKGAQVRLILVKCSKPQGYGNYLDNCPANKSQYYVV